MDYVIRKLFSRSQWHSQIAFPTENRREPHLE
ncbi:hypothetical protein T09_8807 [Trichinella sp. T9]|nr:hypothetical protein T09_8807 [Trichinella sp. T9]